jgi:hypothetical protein
MHLPTRASPLACSNLLTGSDLSPSQIATMVLKFLSCLIDRQLQQVSILKAILYLLHFHISRLWNIYDVISNHEWRQHSCKEYGLSVWTLAKTESAGNSVWECRKQNLLTLISNIHEVFYQWHSFFMLLKHRHRLKRDFCFAWWTK